MDKLLSALWSLFCMLLGIVMLTSSLYMSITQGVTIFRIAGGVISATVILTQIVAPIIYLLETIKNKM